MKHSKILIAVLAAMGFTGSALAAVSAEEAKQLGSTLTSLGAEKAGNKDGSIPEYTGGLPTSTNPPGFKKGSGKWVNPYASEKPLLSITAQNADKYADKLTEASKAIFKRDPSYRIDVYPSHRSSNVPKYIADATLRNATNARTANNGLAIENAISGIPFPIPKTGNEVMWNHMARYQATAAEFHSKNFYVDANSKVVLSGELNVSQQWPTQRQGATAEELKKDGGIIFQAAYNFLNPPRNLGDCTLYWDTMTPTSYPRKAWSYSASTRRVRLAPDFAYDTPVSSMGGVATYDEASIYQGTMDRFDFKLVGKREMYIPYNSYDVIFHPDSTKLLTPKHMNPDPVRWELHRVWVVEATLKPGLRHLYSKRVFYFDEDWTGSAASDEYDSAGKLYKGFFEGSAQLYDLQAISSFTFWGYDLSTGTYTLAISYVDDGYFKPRDKLWPVSTFTPDGLAARSKQ
jgi:Protein of unknown function (DUF1329)